MVATIRIEAKSGVLANVGEPVQGLTSPIEREAMEQSIQSKKQELVPKAG